MTDDENLDFVGGQVQAIISFLHALIEIHPDSAALAAKFEAISQVALALVEGKLVRDDFLDGLADATRRLKLAVETARARQGSQRKRDR